MFCNVFPCTLSSILVYKYTINMVILKKSIKRSNNFKSESMELPSPSYNMEPKNDGFLQKSPIPGCHFQVNHVKLEFLVHPNHLGFPFFSRFWFPLDWRLLQHCGDLRHEQRLGLAVATKVRGWGGCGGWHDGDDDPGVFSATKRGQEFCYPKGSAVFNSFERTTVLPKSPNHRTFMTWAMK